LPAKDAKGRKIFLLYFLSRSFAKLADDVTNTEGKSLIFLSRPFAYFAGISIFTMRFHPVRALPGAWLIDLEKRGDERGFLARTFCAEEFAAHGLCTHWPQCNLTLTRQRGAIRGLHFQAEPQPEIKLIRCTAGVIWDVALDLRPGSPSRGQWQAFELDADTGRALYLPAGFAHGFQCLTDDCQVFYHMSAAYAPALARGVRWDDPSLAISWPLPAALVSEKDRALPLCAELDERELTPFSK